MVRIVFEGFFSIFFILCMIKIVLKCFKIMLHFAGYVNDLFTSAVNICVTGGFDDEELPPLAIPENLNSTFEIPDKQEAIRNHRSRFNAV